MTTLYEIKNSLLELANMDADCEDMREAIRNTMDAVDGEFREKALAVAHYIKNIDADAESIDAEIKRLTARKKAVNAKQDAIKDYLRSNMDATGIKKIECPIFTILAVQGREIASIDNESLLPDEFVEIKAVIQPKKAEILKALKSGADVPGASIKKSGTSIRIN
jgi:chaperonin cofactor prefoldin